MSSGDRDEASGVSETVAGSRGGCSVVAARRMRKPALKEIRIGYQKTGVLVIARQQAVLEKHFATRQIGIKWIEFTSGRRCWKP